MRKSTLKLVTSAILDDHDVDTLDAWKRVQQNIVINCCNVEDMLEVTNSVLDNILNKKDMSK